ncbi:hypothetical protein AB6A40_002226 [Gnathostoma spinigerum]|uniref:Protein pad-1 n=1 Tax=Gnathostoma spinigerum TaxID=75299 RepID=A0ABD6EG36_9BILA
MSSVLVGGTDATSSGGISQTPSWINSNKYRAYCASVDKALKAFETTNEWADLISALAKLSRVFHANAKFGDIPKPVTVAKRLSQCLHPALPHGVHLKALETYRQLFDILGQRSLPKLLYLFAVGLFPLMDHCGIKVKSELLSIFEQYLLPLGAALKPALPGFITGVLLGLEEGTEFYERSFNLLDQVQERVGSECFFACLWQAVLGSPSVRLPALIYVNAKFDRRKPMEDQIFIMGDHVDHMIAALCAAADDDGSTLVQRHLLDFLSSAFPLNSDHLVREDFVQLLRRCLFVVLRRDMSLNRRLYQWLLNKSNDNPLSILPVIGAEDQVDTSFFKTYALPFIREAIEEYLQLDTVEVAVGSTAWDGSKEHQIQFTEVRVCRLLLYFLDRPELGNLILQETFPMLLECCTKQDSRILEVMTEKNYQKSGPFDMTAPTSSVRLSHGDSGRRPSTVSRTSSSSKGSKIDSATLSECEDSLGYSKSKRLDEVCKTINLLTNSLDVGFVWSFLGARFKKLLLSKAVDEPNGVLDPECVTNETQRLKEDAQRRKNEEIDVFPTVVLFCLRTLELDSNGDIRGRHLPNLFVAIISSVVEKHISRIDVHNATQFLSVARAILMEINQSAVAVEAGLIMKQRRDPQSLSDVSETDSTRRQVILENGLDEQRQLESCLYECERLVAQTCEWYCDQRNPESLRMLEAVNSLFGDFADFPLYSFGPLPPSPLRRYVPISDHEYPDWLKGLLCVISPSLISGEKNIPNRILGVHWRDQTKSPMSSDVTDFFIRANTLGLIMYLYMRSASVAEQHAAIVSRHCRSLCSFNGFDSTGCSKNTTTVLLKPLLSDKDLKKLEEDAVFKKIGEMIWKQLDEDLSYSYHGTVSKLLILLHSRRSNEPSSDIEDLVVTDLTSSNKMTSIKAMQKFQAIWSLSRKSPEADICSCLTWKPFNRVVMILLGILAGDPISCENAELKSLVASWFIDCAKHNDLPKILQILGVMLLNPTTARISIQYISMHSRLSKEQLPNMPPGLCAVSLVTESGRQSLHHLCEDVSSVSVHSSRNVLEKSRYRDIFSMPGWLAEVKNRLLQSSEPEVADIEKPVVGQGHRRTMSLIPNFDEDNDSLGSASLDSVDQDVVDAMQHLIDLVCDEEESEMDANARFAGDQICSHGVISSDSYTDVIPQRDLESATDSAPISSSASQLHRMTNIPNTVPNVQQESLEASATSAVESVKRFKTGHRRQDSFHESIFTMSPQDLKLFDAAELPKSLSSEGDSKQPLCHELHAHMLLYIEGGQLTDLSRVEKVMRILISLMRTQRCFMASRLIVSCMTTCGTTPATQSSICESSTSQLVDLLTRHVRSILGQEFWATSDSEGAPIPEVMKNKQYTFLELFMTVSLYFLRSYYLNSPVSPVSDNDLRDLWKCKMAALEFLADLVREIIALVRENQSRSFVTYIYSTLQRVKLQKCLLHSLLTSVHNAKANSAPGDILPLSVDIIEFNNGSLCRADQFSALFSGYLRSLLDLTAVVIRLEYELKIGLREFTDAVPSVFYLDKLSVNHQILNSPQHRSALREPYVGIVELRMFLLTMLNALKRNSARHDLWFNFVVQILPYLDRSLSTVCVHIIEQLCKNLESSVNFAYNFPDEIFDIESGKEKQRNNANIVVAAEPYPPNYSLSALETLTALIHYCLLDNSTQTPASTLTNHPSQQTPTGSTSSLPISMISAIPGTRGATELFSSLFKVLSFSDSSPVNASTTLNKTDRSAGCWKQARTDILNAFPHALATICDVWSLVRKKDSVTHRLPTGNSEQVISLILDLLSPIAHSHQQAFLSALALVWLTRSSISPQRAGITRVDCDQASFVYTDAQLDVADLVLNIKVLSFDTLISAVGEALRESVNKANKPLPAPEQQNAFPTEVSLLELLHGCVRATDASSLPGYWSSFQTLFSESPVMNLSPRAVFLQFIILADFVKMVGSATIIEDKAISRGVQETCQKLTEAINIIVGWQLEQTTWLKRTLVVKQDAGFKSQESSPVTESATAGTSLNSSENTSFRGSMPSLVPSRISGFDPATQLPGPGAPGSTFSVSSEKRSSSNLRGSLKDSSSGTKRDPIYSTQALFLLADNLAELVDSICKSEDKERLLPILHSVWGNTLPYLRAKNARNARFFLAGSQLLASMSTFNYMRPVWRKTALDLLIDPAFFRMDIHSLRQWLIVIDHLMTHDKTSFKELLGRISTTQNSALTSLITSKEAEHEMRAQSLKRLAFVVFSSELDQYQAQLPEIQERLADSLRLSQVPMVHAQVFLCYRVLLIRLKPNHFVSMWPAMITELVHVLLQIEQQLIGTANVSDDLKCDRSDQWMALYLAACKLLETLCTLPSGYIAQFQMCHWAFVSSVAATNTDPFVPFTRRINDLLQKKCGKLTPNELKLMSASLISVKTLTNFGELRPFFYALANQNSTFSMTNQSRSEKVVFFLICFYYVSRNT